MAGTKPKKPSLLIACRKGDFRAVQSLLKLGGDPNCAGGKDRVTPLIEAASRGFDNVVALLLRHGADPNALATCCESALAYAASNGHTSIADRLLKAGAHPNCRVMLFGEHASALTMSSGRGEIATVKLLIAAGANPDGFEEWDRPIILAARNQHLEVVRYLLEHGADPNAQSRTRKTVLIPLAARGAADEVKLALQCKAQVNVPDSDGMTPLMWACRNGRLEVVKLLIQAGADVGLRDTFRQRAGIRDSALTWAISQKQRAVVEWLVQRKLAFDKADLERAKTFLNEDRKAEKQKGRQLT